MERTSIMRSLFLKIFFWFWATVVATGVALILTFIVEPRSVPSRWHATLTDTARFSGTIAVETAERDGTGSTSAYLDRMAPRDPHECVPLRFRGKRNRGNRLPGFPRHDFACHGFENLRLQHEVRHCPGRAYAQGAKWPRLHLCHPTSRRASRRSWYQPRLPSFCSGALLFSSPD